MSSDETVARVAKHCNDTEVESSTLELVNGIKPDVVAEVHLPPTQEPRTDSRPEAVQEPTLSATSLAIVKSSDQGVTKTSKSSTKEVITLVDRQGTAYLLPLQLCSTWNDAKDAFKVAFSGNEAAVTEISRGDYILTDENKSKILPAFWEMVVGHEGKYWIVLSSQQPPRRRSWSEENERECQDPQCDTCRLEDESESQDQNYSTHYFEKLQYSVGYHQAGFSSGEPPEFLYKVTYDGSFVLSSDFKFRELPVLEEIRSIIYPRFEVVLEEDLHRKDRPVLRSIDRLGRTSLRLHSPLLLNALRSIVKYSSEAPSGDKDGLKDGLFEYPFKDLYYHKDELEQYKNSSDSARRNHTEEYNAQCNRHIDLLLEYLDAQSTIRYSGFQTLWAKNIPTTTFAGLMFLLKPGSDVYVREDGIWTASVIDRVRGGVSFDASVPGTGFATNYDLLVWNLSFDGKVIKRTLRKFVIPVFDGEREIRSLQLYPTRFEDAVDGGARRQSLITRGKKYFDFAEGPAFLEYTGTGQKQGSKSYDRARVVVEHKSQPWREDGFWGMEYNPDESFDEYNNNINDSLGESARSPRCECSACTASNIQKETYLRATYSDYDNIDLTKREQILDHHYLLCASHMYGFVLKDRSYDILDVDRLNPPRIVQNAIDRLVMRPEKSKETIKAIVKTYTEYNDRSGRFTADFIQGKGEGQIFLLHGPPGTGKTLTAESVAEYTRRPLLSITAADLGHEPVALEQNLLRFFKNANEWDAIVLLDEADVYLERRSINDLRRNSIVSIFLRAMDYFQGILFLTTNRVGHFDEAFMSRIHVSIGYNPLDDDAREQIWENLFRKLKEDHKSGGPEIRYEYEAKAYVKKNDDVKKLKWNGREIRNAFQTAVALAVFDAKTAGEKSSDEEDSIPEVKEKHLTQVVSMSAAFKEYIVSTHEGLEDSDYAFQMGLRDDRHGDPNSSDKKKNGGAKVRLLGGGRDSE